MTLTRPAASNVSGAETDRAVVTVVIADDHPLFRRGVARAIRRSTNLDLIGEAADGREALDLIAALRPDVAVLDHRMPELSGVEVCARLQSTPDPPSTSVLLLSAFEDADLVSAAIAAGAAGYVGKTASQGDICAAIEEVGRGGMAFGTPYGPEVDAAAHDGVPSARPEPAGDP